MVFIQKWNSKYSIIDLKGYWSSSFSDERFWVRWTKTFIRCSITVLMWARLRIIYAEKSNQCK